MEGLHIYVVWGWGRPNVGSPYLHDLNMNHTYGHFAAGMRLLEVYMSLQMERVGVMLMMGSPHFAYTLGTLKGGSKYRKLITTLKIKGKNIDFEVDTGAELSTIPAALYRAKLKQVELEPSSVILRQYDGTTLPTMGEIVVKVFHAQQLVKGRFIIVEKVDNQLPLLGRDWLYRLRLDWPKMLNRRDVGDP